ncbi:MAG: AgmX/PglI C-terminal domain-containing protein [Nannocystaceae bacterium]
MNPSAPHPLSAEIVVLLGDTVLESRELRAGGPREAWTPALRLSGAGLLGLSLLVGLVTPATSVALLAALAGAGLYALGVAARDPRPLDRFVVGEAPGVDLPLRLADDDHSGEGLTPLVQVLEGGVVLRLVEALTGTITGAGEDPEASESIAGLRARGWRSYRLPLGACAQLERGDLRVEIRVRVAAPPPTLERAPLSFDRRLALPQLASAAALALAFFVAATHERDPMAQLIQASAPERLLRAITSVPAPAKDPQRARAEEVAKRAVADASAARPPRPRAAPEPRVDARAPTTVEVDGERVAAPSLARSVGKRQRRRGGEQRLEDFADGDAGAALLGQAAEDWQKIEEASLAHYVNTKDDYDAWEALTKGPPVQRGFGGMELVGKGRTGGGEAEGVSDLDRDKERETILARTFDAPRPAAKVAPRGTLRVGAPRSGSALDRRHLAEVARGGRQQLRRCWERAAQRGADGGKVTLEVTISRRGKVRDARVVDGAAIDGELRRCLTTVAKGWQFAKPDGEATVAYPLDYDAA